MSAVLLQFVGSLIAILVLAWIARRLGLGTEEKIRDEDHARLLADEVLSGFDAAEIAISEDARAAILRDTAGRVMVLRPHGNKFAGRLLGPQSNATISAGTLHVLTGDRRFGDLPMKIANATHWQRGIAAISGGPHA